MNKILLRGAILIGGCAAATAIGLSIASGPAAADTGPVGGLLDTVTTVIGDVLPTPPAPTPASGEQQTEAKPATRPKPIRTAAKTIRTTVVQPALADTRRAVHDTTTAVTDALRTGPATTGTPADYSETTTPTVDLASDPATAPAPAVAPRISACTPQAATGANNPITDRRHGHTRSVAHRHDSTAARSHRTALTTPHPLARAGSDATRGTSTPTAPQPLDVHPTAPWHPTPSRTGPGQWPHYNLAGRLIDVCAPSG